MHSYTVDTSCICCSDKKCYLCKTYKREKEINKKKENSHVIGSTGEMDKK